MTNDGGAPVRLDRVRKEYGSVVAVDGISLDIGPGRFTTLLGPSGSGKTTTLLMVAGFEDPTSGAIFVGDRPIEPVPAHRRNMGMVFQNYALFPHMSVFGNVAFPLEMRGVRRQEIKRRVGEALDRVSLQGLDDRKPRELSGGQQQRVALARALVFRPPVLLMDEPLGALDKNLRQQLQLEIKGIQRDLGLTVIYVTHDQSEALTMSDDIAVFRDGRVVQHGAPQEIYLRPASMFVATFLGEANLIPGRIIERKGDQVAVELATGRVVEASIDSSLVFESDSVVVVVRPEQLEIASPDTAGGFEATIEAVQFVGDAVRVELRNGTASQLVARVPYRAGAGLPVAGEVAKLRWSDGAASVVPHEVLALPQQGR